MDKNEIIERLGEIAKHAVHIIGEEPFIMSLDDGTAVREAIDIIQQSRSQSHWIPCSERLPEEDHWLGGSGRQFSEKVMVTIVNHSDEDTWVDMTYTIDGEWVCELPKYCKIVAWMPLPEAYREGES